MRLLIIFLFMYLVTLPVYSSRYECKTISTECSPKGVIMSPDGKSVCVMNLESCSITVYNTDTGRLNYTIYFPQTSAEGWDYKTESPVPSVAQKPVEGAFTQNGRYLWVSLHNDSSVAVFDMEGYRFDCLVYKDTVKAMLKYADGTVCDKSYLRIAVGKTPKVICVSRDERRVAVSNWHGRSVSIIDSRNFNVITTIPVSEVPRGMVFNKNGSVLYVAIMYGNYIETVDTFLWKRKEFIYGVGAAPRDLIIDREGKYIYCSANQGNNITRLDTSDNKVINTVYVGSGPRTLEFSPDEKTIYVCCYRANRLYAVDVKTFKVIDILPTGVDPVGVDISPSGDMWVTDQGDNTLSVFQRKTCAKNLSVTENI